MRESNCYSAFKINGPSRTAPACGAESPQKGRFLPGMGQKAIFRLCPGHRKKGHFATAPSVWLRRQNLNQRPLGFTADTESLGLGTETLNFLVHFGQLLFMEAMRPSTSLLCAIRISQR